MKLLTWTTRFNFGKYKGLSVEEVLKQNPKYLLWCHKEVDFICFSEDVFTKILKFRTASNEEITYLLEGSEKHSKEKEEVEVEILKKIQEEKKHQYDTKSSSKSSVDFNTFNDQDWLKNAAGTDDPDTLNDVFWNLD